MDPATARLSCSNAAYGSALSVPSAVHRGIKVDAAWTDALGLERDKDTLWTGTETQKPLLSELSLAYIGMDGSCM